MLIQGGNTSGTSRLLFCHHVGGMEPARRERTEADHMHKAMRSWIQLCLKLARPWTFRYMS